MHDPAVPIRSPRRAVAGWLLFDWAAQPWFTLVTTFVYAPFFASAIAADPVEGQALWGYATAAAGLAVALLSPVLGAIADASGARKPWIACFSVMLVLSAAMLWYGAPGADSSIFLVLAAFAIGTIGVEFATVFTNAMMPDLVSRDRLGRLSGYGWAVGYTGGLLSLVLVLGFLAASPETGRTILGFEPLFGLDPAQREGDRAAGPITAIWYLIFVLPLFFFTPDAPRRMTFGAAVRGGISSLSRTFAGLQSNGNLFTFLLANMVYKDGLAAIFAFGGIYAAGVFGWGTIEIGLFGILLTITGTLGAVLGGWCDDRFGPKAVISVALVTLILAVAAILSIDKDSLFFGMMPVAPAGDGLFAGASEVAYLALGGLLGAAAGPMQASSRTLLIAISPRQNITEYFGLFALSGKVTSFIAPVLVATVTAIAASQKAGIAVVLIFFVAGLVILRRVDPGTGG